MNPINVAILTFPNVALFELGCAVELFALPRPEFEHWYRCDIVSFSDKPLQSTAGITLGAKVVADLDPYDLLVIPSWPIDSRDIETVLANQIICLHEKSKRIITFCSGAFLLAELGILDGKKATTHWRYAEDFKQRFPAIDYVDNVLFQFDGNIGCSAGSSSALDLGLEVIRQDHGHATANSVARRLVASPHRKGGQSQFVETPIPVRQNRLSDALDWALANLSDPISIDMLAGKAHLSRRSFDRKFRASYGCSPKQWIVTQRVQLAKRLLEQSTDPIELIAQHCGFDSATTLRHHFRKNLGVSPRLFRDQFASLTNHQN